MWRERHGPIASTVYTILFIVFIMLFLYHTEVNERSNRSNNIVIVGLEISTEGSDLREGVSTFLKEKLGVADAQMSYIKHLGRNINSKNRPIQVSFDSLSSKIKVMRNRAKLAGSKVYLNNDLTRAQQDEERKLRNLRKQLIDSSEFGAKKITISNGRLFVDRQPLSEAEVQDALHSN